MGAFEAIERLFQRDLGDIANINNIGDTRRKPKKYDQSETRTRATFVTRNCVKV